MLNPASGWTLSPALGRTLSPAPGRTLGRHRQAAPPGTGGRLMVPTELAPYPLVRPVASRTRTAARVRSERGAAVARTDEQARPADDRDIANRHGGGDQLRGRQLAADRPRPWSREDLQRRLERLPPGHPSSPYHADGSRKPPPPSLRALELPPPDARERARPDQSDAPAPALEPLTDAEHADHIAQVREFLDEARGRGLATDQQFMADERRGIWSKDRRDVHDALVDALYSRAEDVPDDRMAIMAGGLGGAGKSTVLDSQAGIERSCYLTINPDVIKEEMAARGLIPQVERLVSHGSVRPRP